MKRITILVPVGESILGSIEGPYKVFRQANELLIGMGKPAAFQVELMGCQPETVLSDGLFTLRPTQTLASAARPDLLLIPAPHGDVRQAVAQNQEAIAWIARQYAAGAEVASLCMGAFLLAATGLLDGRQCATHWVAAHEFRAMYPAVELVADRIITDWQGLYSSGGAYSYLNLVLYLLEKYAGRELALRCAKLFQIDISRHSQALFSIFQGLKAHADEPVRRTQEFIETYFQQRLTVDELAAQCCLSRRHFERRFKRATLLPVLEYVQRVKIEAAKQRLESSQAPISEVMGAVGYTDGRSFRALFKEVTGLTPVEYRAKYGSNLGPGQREVVEPSRIG